MNPFLTQSLWLSIDETWILYFGHILTMAGVIITITVLKKMITPILDGIFLKNLQSPTSSLHKNDIISDFISLSCLPILLFLELSFWIAIPIILITSAVLPTTIEYHRRKKYYQKFDSVLADALMGLGSSLRAGLTIQQGLKIAIKTTDPVFSKQAQLVLQQYQLGRPIDECLNEMRNRVPTSACTIAVGALITGRQLGGPLPDILDRIVTTIRSRMKVQSKLAAMTAQGKTQGYIICGSPILVFLGIFFFAEKEFKILTETDVGHMILFLAISLWIIGTGLTWKLLQMEI